jgi:protein-tyrosine phosphatase
MIHPQASSGLIDMHSHVLPGIDDGCIDLDDSLRCIELLMQQGFIGSICTPHVWPRRYPHNTPSHIAGYVVHLRRELEQRGIDYRLWPGGEVRLSTDMIQWMQEYGVPTLGESRCVLVDLWENKWPRWADHCLTWLRQQGYQPILAHPERMGIRGLDQQLRDLEAQGVWLQGNYRPMTGEEGYEADRMVRKLISEGRYHLLALDMHGYDSLHSRLDGLALVEAEFGPRIVESLTRESVLSLILDPPQSV